MKRKFFFFFADCGNLTAPADGSVTFSSGTTFQSVASFDCNTGYTLEGDATRTCQANAAWSNSDPSCKIKGKVLGWIWFSVICFFMFIVVQFDNCINATCILFMNENLSNHKRIL